MPNNINRAVQFLPFDALNGFRESLKEIDKLIEEKKEFNDDFLYEIDNKLQNIKKGDKVLIRYYYNFEYIETVGTIKKIDSVYRFIYLLDSKISFDDIIDINLII